MKKSVKDALTEGIIIMIVAVVLFISFVSASSSTFNKNDFDTELYRVQSGESLWSIAKDNITDEDCDIRDYIGALKELNGIKNGNELRAGEIIEIYKKKGK